jgi:integrase
MSLYKRGKIWWVRFTDPNGNEVRASARTGNKRQVQEFEDNLKSTLWRQCQLGEEARRTWQEAVVKWIDEKVESGKATVGDDVRHFRQLHHTLCDRYLDKIDKTLVDSIRKERKNEGVANATVNRMLEILRGVLLMCVEQGWLRTAPKVKILPKAKVRVRWLSQSEESRLMAELPLHLAEMARFSLATGLRASNVTGLEWGQVDLAGKRAWIHADQSKSGEAIGVPRSVAAIEVVARQIGKHETRVFTYFDKPVEQANTVAWRKALVRAGITNFRWHDLCHTWATVTFSRGHLCMY